MEEFQIVPIEQVVESKSNPRRSFSKQGMKDLTDSVTKHGVLVPLLVRPVDGHFEIIAGSRRLRAAKAANIEELPVRIKEIGDVEALELQILENLQREDVHPLEEALGYEKLLMHPGYDVPAIAAKVAKSESYVYQRLKLVDLTEEVQKAFLEDRITAGHAILIARLQPQDQKQSFEACFDRHRLDKDKACCVSVRQLSGWIQENIHLNLNTAPFSKTDPNLIGPDATSPSAGPCTTCTKRTGFVPQLFPDISWKDTCTDPACYQMKLQTHIAKEKSKLEAKGEKVVQITTDYSYNLRTPEEKKLIPADKYTVIEKKKERCEHKETAIVVSGHKNIGHTIEICRDPDCKQHGGNVSHGYHQDPREKARQKEKEQKRKREIEIRKRTLAEILGRVPATLGPEDRDFIAVAHLHEMTHDKKKILAERHGWEPLETEYTRDYQGAIERELPFLTQEDLQRILIEMSLVGDLIIGTWETIGKPKFLSMIADRYGVNVKAIEKAVDVGFSEKKARKEKKAKDGTKAKKTGTKPAKAEKKRSKPETNPQGNETESAVVACKFCGCGKDVRPLITIREGKICTDCQSKGAHRVARAMEKSG